MANASTTPTDQFRTNAIHVPPGNPLLPMYAPNNLVRLVLWALDTKPHKLVVRVGGAIVAPFHSLPGIVCVNRAIQDRTIQLSLLGVTHSEHLVQRVDVGGAAQIGRRWVVCRWLVWAS